MAKAWGKKEKYSAQRLAIVGTIIMPGPKCVRVYNVTCAPPQRDASCDANHEVMNQWSKCIDFALLPASTSPYAPLAEARRMQRIRGIFYISHMGHILGTKD